MHLILIILMLLVFFILIPVWMLWNLIIVIFKLDEKDEDI
jgi:hypothetical protein